MFYFISTVTYLFLVWLSIGRTIFSLILVTLFNKIKEKEGGGRSFYRGGHPPEGELVQGSSPGCWARMLPGTPWGQAVVRLASRETGPEATAVTQVPDHRVAGVEMVKSGWTVGTF